MTLINKNTDVHNKMSNVAGTAYRRRTSFLPLPWGSRAFDVGIRFQAVQHGKLLERGQFGIIDVGAIFLGEEIGEYPEATPFGDNDGPMHIPVQSFLEDPASQIVRLSTQYVAHGRTKFRFWYPFFFRRLGEPRGLEDSLAMHPFAHGLNGSTQCNT